MPTVLLVGSWHMAQEDDDPPVAELDAVVERLAAFAPDKVAVEVQWSMQATMDEAYPLFCKDEWTSRSEAVQLGFRLARRLGHNGVFAVDVLEEFWDKSVEEVAHRRPDLQAHYDQLMIASLYEAPRGDGSVLGRLRELNQPAVVDEMWAPYVGPLLSIADGDDYPGADMLGSWWRRNLKIAVNLQRIAEPDDRVAAVYGAGHVPILQRILADMPGMTMVDPLEYL